MNDLNCPTASAGPRVAWDRAAAAEAASDWPRAAALYAACVPDAEHGGAAAEFRAGWCCERAGRLEAAIAHYERAAVDTVPTALAVEALFRLGWLALGERDADQAGRHLTRLLVLARRDGVEGNTVDHARFWAAVCVENGGGLSEAAAQYEAIIAASDPDLWPEAAYRRLLCLTQVGDLSGALQAVDILLQPPAPARDAARLQALQALAREERAQIEHARAAA